MQYPVYLLHPQNPWADHGTVFGLGDSVREALVLNRPLDEWVVADPFPEGPVQGPCFVVSSDLWVSPNMWRRFAEAATQHDTVVQLARGENGPGKLSDPLNRLPRTDDKKILFDLYFVPRHQSIDAAFFTAANPITPIDIESPVRRFALPADPHLGENGVIELLWTDAVC